MRPKDLVFYATVASLQLLKWFPSLVLKQMLVTEFAKGSFYLSVAKRSRIERNLNRVFGQNLGDANRLRLTYSSFLAYWQEALSRVITPSEEQILVQASVIGWEYLETALSRGQGIILWECKGLGPRIWAKRILGKRGIRVHQIYGNAHLTAGRNTAPRLKLVQRVIEPLEATSLASILYLPKSASLAYIRKLIGLLRENRVLCIAGDGRGGQKYVHCEFLGRLESFSTGMVSLARQAGAALIPVFYLVQDGLPQVIIEPALDVGRGDVRERRFESIVVRYVRRMESYIQKYPEQYRNWHLRG